MSRRLMLYAALLAVVGTALISTPSLAGLGDTERVSVSSSGDQGDLASATAYDRCFSADGRYVAFESSSSNLVPGDTNGTRDVFVHDRVTGGTERVSVSSSGGQGNDWSDSPSISADGRYVAFYSRASNLVAGDTNAVADIFVHDRVTGGTERVSVSSTGEQGDGAWPSISADGRYVAFYSSASNLVPGDTNGAFDVFVHDRVTGETIRVSVSSSGVEGNSMSGLPTISADGRYVAFHSIASNLVPGDTNSGFDVFVHDLVTGETERVSVSSAGEESNDGSVYSYGLAISSDGRYVAFPSNASNLVPGDTNGKIDVFVHDRVTGATERVVVSSSGEQGNDHSAFASISADGRYVAFQSEATNLTTGETNGKTAVDMHGIFPRYKSKFGRLRIRPGNRRDGTRLRLLRRRAGQR